MQHTWHGSRIDGDLYHECRYKISSAPILRKTFELKEKPGTAVVSLCALGWHELYVNGKKTDDCVLTPTGKMT